MSVSTERENKVPLANELRKLSYTILNITKHLAAVWERGRKKSGILLRSPKSRLKRKKNCFLLVSSFFIIICHCMNGPIEQLPSSTWLKKLLARWINSPASNWPASLRLHSQNDAKGTDFSGQDVVLWLQSVRQKEDENDAMWTRNLFSSFFVPMCLQIGLGGQWSAKPTALRIKLKVKIS